MHRLIVALLSAFDALVAAAAGLAAVAASVTVLWVFGLSGASWGGVWPSTATVWQLGHLVPVEIRLDEDTIAALGIAPDGTSFLLSLAPLGFAAFTIAFAARSGRRAAHEGPWISGVLAGTVVYAVIAWLVWLSGQTDTAAVHGVQAVMFPALLYGLSALVGALVRAWNEGDDGVVDRLRARVEALPAAWGAVPGLAFRGLGVVVAGLIGVGAIGVLAAVVFRGGDMVGLYEAARVDLLGAVMFTIVHLAYLPTMILWSLSWIAGPGFAVGIGTTVSPAATHLGVVPALPVFGLVPEQGNVILIAALLLPVAVGALAGWIVRSRFAARFGAAEPMLPRAVLTLAVALLTAVLAALAALAASGSIGPGRLAVNGPDPLWLALALGAEIGVGFAILMLAPRSHEVVDDAWLAAQTDD